MLDGSDFLRKRMKHIDEDTKIQRGACATGGGMRVNICPVIAANRISWYND
jgi:hypothetical protein